MTRTGALRLGMRKPPDGRRRARSYRLVTVTIAPVGRKLRYSIESPLFCSRMNAPIRNRGTHSLDDQVWLHLFGRRAAVVAFWKRGAPITRNVRLGTLGYDACDSALRSARPTVRSRK